QSPRQRSRAMKFWLCRAVLLGGAVMVVAVAGAWYYRKFAVYHDYTPLAFTREGWAIADAEHRCYMLNDLLNKRLLEGKAIDEVRDLLGQPDNGSEFALHYRVGYRGFNERAPMVFSYTLFIDFDANGRVGRVYTGD